MIVETPKEFTIEAYEEFLKEHTPWCVDSDYSIGQFGYAQRVYDDAIDSGASEDDATYEALDFLYSNSKFSILYAIIDILEKHFAERVPAERRREVALDVYDDCLDIFNENPCDDCAVSLGLYDNYVVSPVICRIEEYLGEE